MNIYSLPSQLHTIPHAERIIAVGVFDGIHIGHRTVLSRALMEHALAPAVFTFCNTGELKSGGFLQTDAQRRSDLENLEFSDLFEADFSAIKDMSPANFVDMLKNELGAKAIVCGFNFRFGKGGVGDTVLLQELCDAASIQVYVQPAIEVDGMTVSSTRIKQALESGDMQTVMRLQNRPFTICAPVSGGQHLGRQLGSPTINQYLPQDAALPRFGVYASIAIVNGHALPAVTNIGIRPTVGTAAPLAETYILDFEQDLYDREITVQLIRFLRAEEKFNSVDVLKAQIHADAKATRDLFSEKGGKKRAILFDFDNTLQDRQIAFLLCMQDFVGHHFPDMDPSEIKKNADILLNTAQFGFVPYRKVLEKATQLLPFEEPLDFKEAYTFLEIAYPLHTTLFADAVETLTELKKRGYLLGMLTNGISRIQNCKVDVSGLRPLLDYVMVSGDEKLQKPDPEPFYRVAYRLGVAPADCVYVGDNPINDVQGAKAAGMTPVFRDFSYPGVEVEDPSVLRVRCLHDLLDMYK